MSERPEVVIRRLKSNQTKGRVESATSGFRSNAEKLDSLSNSQRISKKNRVSVDNETKRREIKKIALLLLTNEITKGQALRHLRLSVLGVKQDAYANLVSVSRKTISDIENDRGEFSNETLNRVFSPIGLQVGLVPKSESTLRAFLSKY